MPPVGRLRTLQAATVSMCASRALRYLGGAFASLGFAEVAMAQDVSLVGGWVFMIGSVAQPIPQGRPFSARYTETRRGPHGSEEVASGRIFVDRRGRVRNDDLGRGKATLVDPVTGRMAILNASSGAVLARPRLAKAPPVVSSETSTSAQKGGPGAAAETLGVRDIAGVSCSGFRLQLEVGDDRIEHEVWRAQELGIIVRRYERIAGEEHIFALTGIREGDVDPALFAAVAD